MKTIRYTLTHNWTLPRMLWVVLGLVITVEAVSRKEPVAAILGLLYMGMGLLNKTLCASGACAIPAKAKQEKVAGTETTSLQKTEP